MTSKDIAYHIRTFRAAKKLTQIKFGQLANVNPTLISRIETGKTKYPNHNTIYSICKVLNVSISEFFPPTSIKIPEKELHPNNYNELILQNQLLEIKLKKSQELIDFLISQR